MATVTIFFKWSSAEGVNDHKYNRLCSTNIQVLTFVSNIIFKSCTPADSVCQTIKDCILVSKEQIVLLKVLNLTSDEL